MAEQTLAGEQDGRRLDEDVAVTPSIIVIGL